MLSFTKFLRTRLGLTLAAVAVVLALGLVAVWEGRRSLVRAEARGRDSALLDVARVADSTAAVRVVQAKVLWLAQQHTDTVWRDYGAKVSRAGAAIAAIPPAIRDSIPPVIGEALDACEALVADTAKLRAAQLTERAEARELFRLDTLAIDGLKAQVVAKGDTIRTLSKRWTRKQALGGAAVAALLAFFGGRQ